MSLTSLNQYKEQFSQELSSPIVQWAGLCSLLLVFIMFVVSPYLSWRDSYMSDLEQASIRLQRLEGLAQSRSHIDQLTQDIDTTYQQLQSSLIQAKTNGRALSTQVTAFERIFTLIGLKFSGRRFGDATFTPWVGDTIESQWRLRGTSEQVLSLVYALAHEKTIFRVTSLDIKPLKGKKGSSGLFEVALTIQGYRAMPVTQVKQQTAMLEKR